MNIICYIYYEVAINNSLLLISRLQKELDIQRVCIVYRAGLNVIGIRNALKNYRISNHVEFVSYDGVNWEFGAYQLGCDRLNGNWGDGVLVFNDTAGRNYPFFHSDLRRFSREVRDSLEIDSPVIVGKLESVNLNFELCGLKFSQWIRSNIFFINRASIMVLNGKLFDNELFNLPVSSNGRLTFGCAVSQTLESYLLNWLYPESLSKGWRGHVGKTVVSQEVLRSKAGSILLEKRISALILNKGGAMVTYEPRVGRWLYRFRIRMFFKARRCRNRFGAIFSSLKLNF